MATNSDFVTKILQSLGLSEESSLNDLVIKLKSINTVTNTEINNILNISVKTLPNTVTNQADMLKRRMYGIATDENFGLTSVINRRVVLLSMITEKMFNQTQQNTNIIDNLTTIVRNKQDRLIAGNGIDITNNVISVKEEYLLTNLTADEINEIINGGQ